jgi:hypothetical protein
VTRSLCVLSPHLGTVQVLASPGLGFFVLLLWTVQLYKLPFFYQNFTVNMLGQLEKMKHRCFRSADHVEGRGISQKFQWFLLLEGGGVACHWSLEKRCIYQCSVLFVKAKFRRRVEVSNFFPPPIHPHTFCFGIWPAEALNVDGAFPNLDHRTTVRLI